mgnify:FL=1
MKQSLIEAVIIIFLLIILNLLGQRFPGAANVIVWVIFLWGLADIGTGIAHWIAGR